jgi:hypothetical protein
MTYTELVLKELSGTTYRVKVNGAFTLYELNVEFNRQHVRSVEITFLNHGRALAKDSPVSQLFNINHLYITTRRVHSNLWTAAAIRSAIETDPFILFHVYYFLCLMNPEFKTTPPNILSTLVKSQIQEDEFSLPVMYDFEYHDPLFNLT